MATRSVPKVADPDVICATCHGRVWRCNVANEDQQAGDADLGPTHVGPHYHHVWLEAGWHDVEPVTVAPATYGELEAGA